LNSDFTVVCEVQAAACRISLSGRITIDSSPDLRDLMLLRLQPASCRSLTVDFRDVTYIDTSGLAVLLELLKASRDQGKTFGLSGLRERPRYLLEASRLLHFFDSTDEDVQAP
jgi:anti-sigma B factor antagonist